MLCKSISQLNARYGKDYADSIHGGFNTYLTYSGADPQTTQFFENIIGRVRERQKKEFDDPTDQYREYNLLNASEVRTISSDETLIVSSNRQPVRLKTTPYFENWTFKRQSKKGVCSLAGASQDERLDKVRL